MACDRNSCENMHLIAGVFSLCEGIIQYCTTSIVMLSISDSTSLDKLVYEPHRFFLMDSALSNWDHRPAWSLVTRDGCQTVAGPVSDANGDIFPGWSVQEDGSCMFTVLVWFIDKQ